MALDSAQDGQKFAAVPIRSRNSTALIHDHVRDAILRGDLAAGTELSQADLARAFRVSRGPVREALRLLQREGLVDAEVNQRAQVAEISVADVEELYALRIINESFAIRLSVPHFTEEDFAQMNKLLNDMETLDREDIEAWETPHRCFHFSLMAYAGDRPLRTIRQHYDHSERYRRKYLDEVPRAWALAPIDHREIAEACFQRDSNLAAKRLVRHLARTALTVLLITAPPEHEPTVVRTALGSVTGAADEALVLPTEDGETKAPPGALLP